MLIRAESNGTVLASLANAQRAYLPFGYSRPSGIGSGFTGQYEDNGLYLLGNGYRTYRRGLKRFGTADRIGPFASPDRTVYGYCRADPVNRTDRSGRYSLP